ncbi:hypothetical protein [Desulfotignum phosphitoxidans]|jgi:hypothetical protein|uniref:Uncharacterized protein n=1 Tax=Desulfotignum phosphitoxidans DSM 13687 TaxID=1286635 RepID=S0G4F5_9BACT|nr:hypothetical protein [Desulfotignum phosphitoxidans]EMS80489.1 hypothetical protein Dpo_2c01780 [Desulfotignum phosphitoxidans DSM 13687]
MQGLSQFFLGQTTGLAQGQKLVKEGKTLETDEQNLAELTSQAEGFAEKLLPVLRGPGVVPYKSKTHRVEY